MMAILVIEHTLETFHIPILFALPLDQSIQRLLHSAKPRFPRSFPLSMRSVAGNVPLNALFVAGPSPDILESATLHLFRHEFHSAVPRIVPSVHSLPLQIMARDAQLGVVSKIDPRPFVQHAVHHSDSTLSFFAALSAASSPSPSMLDLSSFGSPPSPGPAVGARFSSAAPRSDSPYFVCFGPFSRRSLSQLIRPHRHHHQHRDRPHSLHIPSGSSSNCIRHHIR